MKQIISGPVSDYVRILLEEFLDCFRIFLDRFRSILHCCHTFLFLQHEAVVWLSLPLWWEWMWPGRTRSGSLVTQSRTPVQARPLPGRSTWSTSWSSASGTGRPTAWSGGLRSFTTATVRSCCTRCIQSFQNISNALSTFWAKELILKGIKR